MHYFTFHKRLLVLFCVFLAVVYDATGHNIDSLKQVLASTSSPASAKVDAFSSLANIYNETNPDSAVYLANQGLQLATQQHNDKGAGDCLKALGLASMKRNEAAKALQYYWKAVKEYEVANFSTGKISAILSIADVYSRESKYDTAIKYYEEGIKLSEKSGSAKHKGLALMSMAGINSDLGNHAEALKYYLEALKVFEKSDDQKYISRALTNIAGVYSALGDNKKALSYIDRGITLSKQLNSRESLLSNYVNAGMVYGGMRDLKSALPYFEKAAKIADTLQDTNWIVACKSNLATTYFGMGMNQQSLTCYKEVLKLVADMHDASAIVVANEGIGKVLADMGNLKEGVKHFHAAYAVALEKGLKEKISDMALYLSMAYEDLKDAATALKYHKIYADYKDSVFNENSSQQIHQLQFDYDLAKKESRIQLLEKNKEVAQVNAKNHMVQLWALSGGVLLMAAISALLYRSRRLAIRNRNMLLKQKEEIQEQARRLESLNQFKDKTFSVLSHDLRSPINQFTVVMMMLDEEMMTHEQLMALKPAMQRQLHSLNSLLDGLLKWATNYMQGQASAKPEPVNLSQVTQQCVSLLQQDAENKKIKIVNELPADLTAYCDPGQLDIVIRNLVVNAIKFTRTDGTITLHASRGNSGVQFSVSDTGVGMNEEQLARVFMPVSERNTYGTDGERGLGLGLLLCHEFIKANNGGISVSSEPEKGSVFTVTLPVQLN